LKQSEKNKIIYYLLFIHLLFLLTINLVFIFRETLEDK